MPLIARRVMTKTCSLCGSPRFSKGLCRYHWGIEYQKPLSRKPLKRFVTKIEYISNKKSKLDEEYYTVCRELDREARDKGLCICFFCGGPLETDPETRLPRCDHHHLAGKSGKSDNGISLYLDKSGIVLCHRKCHREYHDIKISELLKAAFYDRLMEKILYLCKSKYYNMKSKHDEYTKSL